MQKNTIPGLSQNIYGSVYVGLCSHMVQIYLKIVVMNKMDCKTSRNDCVITSVCNFQALVQEDPNYVVRRYESGKYAIDQSVTNEYLKVKLPKFNFFVPGFFAK